MTLKGLIESARSDAVGYCERGDEETVRAYVVVLVALVLGPDADVIARYTGYPRPWVRAISKEMRRRTLWHGSTVEGHPWHPETDPQIGAVEWTLHAMAALGRVEVEKDGWEAPVTHKIRLGTWPREELALEDVAGCRLAALGRTESA